MSNLLKRLYIKHVRRPLLFRKFFKEIVKHDIKSNNELLEGSTVGVVRVKNFKPIDNEYWELEANKSYPRDVYCSTCKEQVVMSNEMFRMYSVSSHKKTVKIICEVCMKERMKSANKIVSTGTDKLSVEKYF